ncbi:MAG: carbohydrate kinase, partial [Treponema sp.]|nr:carbohydrate kinase [Treponema sp.]
MKCLMGIDMGGTMVKAALFDTEGRELATRGKRLAVLYPGKDMNERNIEEAEQATYAAIKEAIEAAKVDPADIQGIGVTGMANGLYMFDENNKPVRNAILSGDLRAKNYIKKWYADGTFEKLLPKIRQSIWAGNVPALIAWFKDNDKSALDRTKTIVTAKDFVRFLLTGVYSQEITEASAIASMDQTQDLITEEIFAIYGISEYLDKLPKKIARCSEIVGTVTNTCAEKTGLKAGTPVVGGLADVVASIVSVGVTDENKWGIIVGTWGINAFVKNNPIPSPDIFMIFHYCIENLWEYLEGSSTSASNLEWFIDCFLDREKETQIYAKCNQLVEQVPWRDSIIFLPFLYGTNVNIDAKSAFIGLKGNHNPASMVRAIYEGVVFCHWYHLERLTKFAPMPKVVRMAGGAARSKTWMQMFADILGVRVEVPEAEELGALGAAMLAGVGVGVYKDVVESVNACTKISA